MGIDIYSPPECASCGDRAWIDLRKWGLGCWCAPCLATVVDQGASSDIKDKLERFLTGEGDG